MKKKLITLLLTLYVTAFMTAAAYAAEPLEYTIAGTDNPEYGKPTSIEVVHTPDGGAMKNEDISKNAALAPPAFGSASADTLHTGIPITPNLAPGYMPDTNAVINGSAAAVHPRHGRRNGLRYRGALCPRFVHRDSDQSRRCCGRLYGGDR